MRDQKPHTPPPARRGDDAIPMNGAGFGAPLQHAKPGTSMMKLEAGPVTAIQVAVPRVLAEVKERVLEEVGMMGESFFYRWTVKDKHSKTGESTIQGMSIEGAKVLYRNWRNANYTIEVYDESPRDWTFLATLVDWENGSTFPRLFRQRKAQTSGDGMNAERQMDIAFQIGQSKAIRNAIAMAMPAWLVDEAMALAENSAVNKYAVNLPWAIFEMLKAAKLHGVSKEELWKKAGKEFNLFQGDDKKWHVDPLTWLPKDVADMMAILRAITDRQTTADIEFRGSATQNQEPEPPAPPEQPVPPVPTTAMSDDFGGAVPAVPPAPAPTPAVQASAAPPAPAAAPAPAPAQTERRQRRQREPGED